MHADIIQENNLTYTKSNLSTIVHWFLCLKKTAQPLKRYSLKL